MRRSLYILKLKREVSNPTQPQSLKISTSGTVSESSVLRVSSILISFYQSTVFSEAEAYIYYSFNELCYTCLDDVDELRNFSADIIPGKDIMSFGKTKISLQQ